MDSLRIVKLPEDMAASFDTAFRKKCAARRNDEAPETYVLELLMDA